MQREGGRGGRTRAKRRETTREGLRERDREREDKLVGEKERVRTPERGTGIKSVCARVCERESETEEKDLREIEKEERVCV
jgi:hypothetical protein